MTATNFQDFGFLAERHPSWNTLLDSIMIKWPCISISLFRTGKIKVTSCSQVCNFNTCFRKGFDLGRLENIFKVAKTKLSPVVSSPSNDFVGLLNKQEAPIFNSNSLLDPHSPLILNLSLFVSIYYVVKINHRMLD
jgi:hypothetical protein